MHYDKEIVFFFFFLISTSGKHTEAGKQEKQLHGFQAIANKGNAS